MKYTEKEKIKFSTYLNEMFERYPRKRAELARYLNVSEDKINSFINGISMPDEEQKYLIDSYFYGLENYGAYSVLEPDDFIRTVNKYLDIFQGMITVEELGNVISKSKSTMRNILIGKSEATASEQYAVLKKFYDLCTDDKFSCAKPQYAEYERSLREMLFLDHDDEILFRFADIMKRFADYWNDIDEALEHISSDWDVPDAEFRIMCRRNDYFMDVRKKCYILRECMRFVPFTDFFGRNTKNTMLHFIDRDDLVNSYKSELPDAVIRKYPPAVSRLIFEHIYAFVNNISCRMNFIYAMISKKKCSENELYKIDSPVYSLVGIFDYIRSMPETIQRFKIDKLISEIKRPALDIYSYDGKKTNGFFTDAYDMMCIAKDTGNVYEYYSRIPADKIPDISFSRKRNIPLICGEKNVKQCMIEIDRKIRFSDFDWKLWILITEASLSVENAEKLVEIFFE